MDEPLLKRVTAEELPIVERIYLEAFPENERMEFSRLIADPLQGRKEILGIYQPEGQLVGFFALYYIGNLVYLMYFAVDRNRRGHGTGTKALHQLYDLMDTKQAIVIDIERVFPEAPTYEVMARRRSFYAREGFYFSGVYSHFFGVDFEIMVHGPKISPQEIIELFENAWAHYQVDIYLDGDTLRIRGQE